MAMQNKHMLECWRRNVGGRTALLGVCGCVFMGRGESLL